jgi:hypothetical protein
VRGENSGVSEEENPMVRPLLLRSRHVAPAAYCDGGAGGSFLGAP